MKKIKLQNKKKRFFEKISEKNKKNFVNYLWENIQNSRIIMRENGFILICVQRANQCQTKMVHNPNEWRRVHWVDCCCNPMDKSLFSLKKCRLYIRLRKCSKYKCFRGKRRCDVLSADRWDEEMLPVRRLETLI